MQKYVGANLWLDLAGAILAAAVCGALVATFISHRRGIYYALMTIAFCQIFWFVAIKWHSVTGGEDGLLGLKRMPAELGFTAISLTDNVALYYFVLVVCVVVTALLWRIVHSPFGRVIQAIRENETRMEAVGYATFRYKLACFVIAGSLAGLAGALLATQNNYVNPGILHWTESGKLMIMVILGGVGHLYGGLIGAVGLLGLEELLANHKIAWLAALYPNYQQHSLLAVGVAMLGVVLYAPQGISGLFTRKSKDD